MFTFPEVKTKERENHRSISDEKMNRNYRIKREER
jgi:hypothetical protein